MVKYNYLLLCTELALFHLIIHFDELPVIVHEALLDKIAFEVIVVSVGVYV